MNKKIIFNVLLTATFWSHAQNPGIRINYIDSTVKPGNDFYTYCNGNWQKSFKLSESDSRYGSFNEINDNNLKNIRFIYQEASLAKGAKPGSNDQKLRDFYNVAMDSAKAEKLDIKPIIPLLNQINSVPTKEALVKLKANIEPLGVRLFYAVMAETDLKNSKKYSVYLSQAGYGLPDKDFYYNANFKAIADKYTSHIANMLVLLGAKPEIAKTDAAKIFEFEKKLLYKGKSTPEMRDIEKLYNPVSKKELASLSPILQFDQYFKMIGIPQTDTVILMSKEYVGAIEELIQQTDLNTLKLYAKWQLINEAASYLSSRFEKERFSFYGKTLSGSQVMKARWQRVHNVINASIGDLISEAYVKKHFPPSSKEKLNILIDNLIAAYRERIDSRTWMDATTKKQAHRKLDLLIRKIGYPDTWKNYSKLSVTTSSYWDNVAKANAFNFIENLEDLKKPVDRNKWQMTAVTVNAYYNPTTNEITFPAAILQPPFYDPNADDAANYGTMGAIIGHELSHGFDDQGSQFDADGNMKNWWSDQDLNNFKTKKQGIVNQFNNYIAIDSMHVNGEMTQGENIADLGGLTMAYHAYKKSLKGKASTIIGGFTGEQRFFIAWCQGWKTVTRDEELKRLITVDFHSPGYFRAWAPLTNLNEFYEAFKVKEGDKLYVAPEKRVEIW
jgi:putative endopeptidase